MEKIKSKVKILHPLPVDSITAEIDIEVFYSDNVYCVELEKFNTLLVRRNGFVVWSGNCRSTTAIVMDKEGLTRMARDEATGKTYLVPASMGYKEWEKKYRK